ncbi:hypothetical protein [Nostocoides sp. HKS02]|uniref:hypothetical protein n=1 Tax=Nostocoides sp. HKS02 TaxID=1813880 RepID=UPI0012B49685|nr:hypothetical protein [Tetrasphaera sp. HKS02]QGN59086.1 hypothetical protein GKE56_15680 [Tetrasphaera sp. HKS02]
MEHSGCGVFVFGKDGDVMAFPDLETAAGWMESIDVLEGEYEAAFTVDGREVTIVGERESPVSLRATDVRDLDGLRKRLARSGDHLGLNFPLSDLTAVANDLMRWQWEQRWPRWVSRLFGGKGPPQV